MMTKLAVVPVGTTAEMMYMTSGVPSVPLICETSHLMPPIVQLTKVAPLELPVIPITRRVENAVPIETDDQVKVDEPPPLAATKIA